MNRVISIFHYIPTVMVLAAILYLSLAPTPVPDTGGFFDFPGSDKIVHGIMYMGLTFIFCFDYYRHTPVKYEKYDSRTMLVVFIAAIIIGGVIEVLQQAMHMGRSGDIYDFISDAIGAAIGIGLGVWIIKPFFLSRQAKTAH